MLSAFKNLAKRKDGSGPLTGRTVKVQSYLVKVEAVLGEGGFATIYRCSDNTTKATFALKHFRLSGHPEAVRDVQTEVAVMKALRESPYVLHLRAVAFGGPPGAEDEAFLLLDYCKDNLVHYLQARNFAVDDHSVLRIFMPVCRAVQAMHSLDPPLTHRDLKAENVLLHTNEQWVLCDFGSATSQEQVYSNPREIAIEEENIRKHTTPAYRAPEMWDLYAREFIGSKVDVWALGCLLYLLCFGRLPFDGDAKLQILNGQYTMPASRPEPLRALIRDMLLVDSRRRLGIDEVVRRLEQLAPADLSRPLPTSNLPAPLPAASPVQNSYSSTQSSAAHAQNSEPASGRTTPSSAPPRAAAAPGLSAHPVPSSSGQRASGSFWDSQPQPAQQPAEEEGGWASFGSQDLSAAPPSQLYPSLATASAAEGPPAAGASPARGSTNGSGAPDPSWTSFNSPSPTHGKAKGGGSSATASRPGTAAHSSTPAPIAMPTEGPLSAGLRAIAGNSPFGSSLSSNGAPTPPSRGPSAPAAEPPAATAPASAAAQSQGRPAELAPLPVGSSGALSTQADSRNLIEPLHSGLGSQPRSRAGSDVTPPPRHASPYKPSYASGSLPGSPKHSRESSRTIDALSRSSGSVLAADDAVAAALSARSEGAGLTDTEQLQLRTMQLEEHCRVLEQLLEEKAEEVAALREENSRQAQELQHLRQQQSQQGERRSKQAAASTPPQMPRSSSSLGSNGGRAGQLKVEEESQGSPSWVAFGSGGRELQGDAPTPTLLKPSTSKPLAQGFPPISPVELTPAAPATVSAQNPLETTPMSELLRAQLDLGAGAGAGQAGGARMHKTPPTQLALSNGSSGLGSRSSSGNFMQPLAPLDPAGSSGGWDLQPPFVEFNPLVNGEGDTPKPPLRRQQESAVPRPGRSGSKSVQPSPAKPLASIAVDNSGSMSGLGGSPLKSRLSGAAGQSPRRGGHRRQVSEPFFSDLNPLG